MDKYEYKLRADEIKSLIQKKQYMEAAAIADTIDWKNVRNSVMLCTISDLYKACKRYEDSREVLLIAYDRNPNGRMIVYSLCELSIKLGDIFNAVEYLKEYAELAPSDPGRFVLKYKLFTAQGVGIEERIAVLEELQRRECKEKWMYELARLYHFGGYSQQCIEECNQIIIYFGEGKYVIKALELMSQHVELSEAHDILYRRLKNPDKDIVVNAMDVSQYNSDDLEKELAKNLKEVLSDEAPVQAPVAEEIIYTSESESSEIQAEEVSKEEEASEPSEPEVTFETTMYKPVVVDEEPKEEATKIIDHKAVNEALMASAESEVNEQPKPEAVSIVPPSNTGFKGQVIEPRKSVWDMHEIDLGNRNSEAIKYPNYDDMVSVEGDGQISIVMPEQEQVDKQITGQISIDDVLLEWERMKDESDKRWAEEVKKRVMSQTTDLLKNFEEASKNGLLEELEISVAGGGKVVLTPEEQMALLNGENPDALNITIDDVNESGAPSEEEEIILLDESEYAGLEASTEVMTQSDEVNSADEQNESSEEVTSEETNIVNAGDMAEISVSEEEVVESEEMVEESEGPTPEELSFDRTPYLTDKEEETASDDTAVLPNLENLDYLMKFAAAIEDHDTAEKVIFGAAEMIAENVAPFDGDSEESVNSELSEEVAETVSEEADAEELQETSECEELVNEDESSDAEETEKETCEEPIEEDSAESIEETVEETTVEEVVTEAEEPISEVIEEEEPTEAEEDTAEEEGETDSENSEEISEEAEEDSKEESSAQSEEVPAEIDSAKSYGLLTEAQYDRFEDFVQTEGVDEQIIEALKSISMTASTGNVIVGSDDTDGAVEFAKMLITEVAESGEVTGKVAKIKASTLNAKDVKATIEALENGAIIIQDIGDLKAETLKTLTEVISNSDFRILVVLTANQRIKHKFIMEHKEVMQLFNVSVDIVSLDDKELVEFGQKYAKEQEYIIDEMGLLALHRRVEEAQTNTHAVTVSEVRAIVDDAIERVSKKNVGHFFDILVGKRYDENDMIVLREKDFE